MPDGQPKTNKLTVYLIKDQFQNLADIVENQGTTLSVPGVGDFIFERSNPHPPGWLEDFFRGTLAGASNIINSSTKGILIAPVQDSNRTIRFAIPFGVGRHLLRDGVIEERFGLKVVLNSLKPESFRSINKTSLGSVAKQSREQMTKEVSPAAFGIDIEQDLITSITGRSDDARLGKIITGKDSLSVSVKVDISNVSDFLKHCYQKYQSVAYRTNFDWIDQIADVRNPVLEAQLDNELISQITSGATGKIWMAVPEVIDWSKSKGFRYLQRKRATIHDDLDLQEFIAELQGTPLDLDTLRHRYVFNIDEATEEADETWSAYRCLSAEISLNGQLYVLNNGKWYQIASSFSQQVMNDFSAIPSSNLSFPDCNVKNEGDYNQAATGSIAGACCMDQELIAYGGNHSKIEFCDIFTASNQIIHVKRYGGSSVLSHLFAQGIVSGELFAGEEGFRTKLNAKLPPSHRLSNPQDRPDTTHYDVIFGIISNDQAALDIPFFSKVILRNARRRLANYGYKVFLNKIYQP